jgi:hypothetical protein
MLRVQKAALLLAAGVTAGSLATPAAASDASIEAALLDGVADMRSTHDVRTLDGQLAGILGRLRAAHSSTAAGRTAKALAVRGLTWTRNGLRARLDFMENDSGNVAAATRDARAADRRLKRGAALLRSAGKALGIRIGRLNGY